MISFRALPLVQGEDEDRLVKLGEVLFDGRITRRPDENGLRLWVEGDPEKPEAAAQQARAMFQTALGVLRVWQPGTGQLVEERWPGLTDGSILDEVGNQWYVVAGVVTYSDPGGTFRTFAEAAKAGLASSVSLRNALWLNGRGSRTAADFYMIYEYAKRGLKGDSNEDGRKSVERALGITRDDQLRLERSANNLSPLAGGRHVEERDAPPEMTLAEQRAFIDDLLRRWITRFR